METIRELEDQIKQDEMKNMIPQVTQILGDKQSNVDLREDIEYRGGDSRSSEFQDFVNDL